jgi:hypothetical protein
MIERIVVYCFLWNNVAVRNSDEKAERQTYVHFYDQVDMCDAAMTPRCVLQPVKHIHK